MPSQGKTRQTKMAFNDNSNTTGTGFGSSYENDGARLSTAEKTKRAVVPDAMKSDSQIRQEQFEGKADNAMSHVPGQGQMGDNFNSDAGNPGLGDNAHTYGNSHTGGMPGTGSGPNYHGSGATALDSHKPHNEQTYGDQARVGADQARSHMQPNDSKPMGTEAHDFVTSGNDSKTGSKLHETKEKVANVFRSEENKNHNV